MISKEKLCYLGLMGFGIAVGAPFHPESLAREMGTVFVVLGFTGVITEMVGDSIRNS